MKKCNDIMKNEYKGKHKKYQQRYVIDIEDYMTLDRFGKIEIPACQRSLVYALKDNQRIIESVLNGLFLPTIYLSSEVGGSYGIYDGQQRYNAIMKYCNNEYATSITYTDRYGKHIGARLFRELPEMMQDDILSSLLDVVVAYNYSQDELDDMFLSINTTKPLKPAEKRRAIKGNMRYVIKDLVSTEERSDTRIFFDKTRVGYDNKRLDYEDIVTKAFANIKGRQRVTKEELHRFYKENEHIDTDDKEYNRLVSSLRFLGRAFKTSNAKIKKFMAHDLIVIADEMLQTTTVSKHAKAFERAVVDFLCIKEKELEKGAGKTSETFARYQNAARSDTDNKWRQQFLMQFIYDSIPNIALKDKRRQFSPEARLVIYENAQHKCVICGKPISISEMNADHIIPHSRGGKTLISNGRCLCEHCNKSLGDRNEKTA